MPARYAKKPMYKKRAPMSNKKYVKKTFKKATNALFAKKVVKIMKRHEETKIGFPYSQVDAPIEAWSGATPSTMYPLIETFNVINQGTGQGSRIGNRISPVSVRVKGSINNVSASTRPYMVKLIIFKDKLNQVTNSAGDLSDLLQVGNSSTNPANLATDIIHYFNKDRYIIYATRTFKLGSSTSTSNPNNDFSVQKFFNIDLSKNFKSIRYNDDTANDVSSPTNLWMTFLISYADNTAITFAPYTGPSCNISFDSVCMFKDD